MKHKLSELHFLNLGAGVQSTTLYLMACRGEIHFDVAGFADTGEEPAPVYAHLERLKQMGGPPIMIASAGRLGDDLINGKNTTGQRFAAIPAFTTPDAGKTIGRTRRQCSKEYKTEVVGRMIRAALGVPKGKAIRGVKVHQYFGISFDEGGRAARIAERFRKEGPKYTQPHFPLIEKMMTRANCLHWLAQHGGLGYEVPRSSCGCCPFHSDAEWQWLKDADPAGWQRAVYIDHALRNGAVAARDMKQQMYLHRSCKPLDLVQLEPKPRDAQMSMSFWAECEGLCGH